MSDFRLEFKLDNAAFEDDRNGEIGRILRELADRFDDGFDDERAGEHGTVRDVNGNTVGDFSIS